MPIEKICTKNIENRSKIFKKEEGSFYRGDKKMLPGKGSIYARS